MFTGNKFGQKQVCTSMVYHSLETASLSKAECPAINLEQIKSYKLHRKILVKMTLDEGGSALPRSLGLISLNVWGKKDGRILTTKAKRVGQSHLNIQFLFLSSYHHLHILHNQSTSQISRSEIKVTIFSDERKILEQ
jgi:hypothetical protein